MNKIVLSKEQYHRGGGYAKVYKVGDRAIKCPRACCVGGLWQDISYEFEIQQQLFEAGIKVARPFEILEAQLDDRIVKAISMEFIEGQNAQILNLGWQFWKYGRPNLKELYAKEIQKAVNLGFSTYDRGLINAVYSKERGLFLIDFQFWKFLK